ncbi:MAG: GNAT family N-acetyltransferase [Actinobacteria bacterium]|nr:GNAT family N-acetyltransferase [Actinomycetota bacterium]
MMIKSLVFKEEPPAADEYVKMRKDAGWSVYKDMDAVRKGLDNSLYHIIVRKGSELIAMGRVIGDGSITFYIQDIIVSREYQGKGIGTVIMKRIMDFIYDTTADGAVVGLFAAKDKESFYKKFHFIIRPNESGGSGMIQYRNRRF